MKTQTLTGLLLLALSTSIFAVGHYPACRPIVLACKAAGFSKGAPVGHRLYKDCLRPILLNQPAAPGALALPTVNPADVTACNAQRAQAQPQQPAVTN